jgi:uncharacterized membrane protein YqhA
MMVLFICGLCSLLSHNLILSSFLCVCLPVCLSISLSLSLYTLFTLKFLLSFLHCLLIYDQCQIDSSHLIVSFFIPNVLYPDVC